jgi:polar amino acid transport system substrate-binding protein
MKNYKLLYHFLLLIVISLQSIPATGQQSKQFRWAADAEGNAPYIFQDISNPGKIIGFEVDIAEAIAREIKKNPLHVQNQWDGLIPGLSRSDYDVALNGIEITEDREEVISFSDPYFITYEQIVVPNNVNNIFTLNDLVGKKVGALKSSLAERILREKRGIIVLTYEGEVNAFEDMENERIDAALVDYPIALYYASTNPQLKLSGQPVGEVRYGVAIRKSDTTLLREVNTAIGEIVKSGKLREIYERWNLWNPMMALFFNDNTQSAISPVDFNKFVESQKSIRGSEDIYKRYLGFLPLIGEAAFMTLKVTILSMLLAVFLGLIVALTRIYAPRPLAAMAVGYIELLRGTPLLIQLYFIFYAAPSIGITLSPFVAAIIGLGINYSAYEAENYRAGLFAVPRGQMEAAVSLGMSRRQSLRHVILPQALRLVIPPMTNDFISLLKDSSLISLLTLVELTKLYFQLSSMYYDFFGIGLMIAIVYLLLGLPFVRLARMFERKYAVDKRKML